MLRPGSEVVDRRNLMKLAMHTRRSQKPQKQIDLKKVFATQFRIAIPQNVTY